MERLLWWTSVLSIVLIVMVLTSLRRAHIRVEYSVTWLIACFALLGLSRSQTVLGWVATTLGLGFAPTVLVLVIGFIFIVMFFWTCVIISRLKDDNIALAQRVAIMEFHLNRLEKDHYGAPTSIEVR
jgi:heme A synthase